MLQAVLADVDAILASTVGKELKSLHSFAQERQHSTQEYGKTVYIPLLLLTGGTWWFTEGHLWATLVVFLLSCVLARDQSKSYNALNTSPIHNVCITCIQLADKAQQKQPLPRSFTDLATEFDKVILTHKKHINYADLVHYAAMCNYNVYAHAPEKVLRTTRDKHLLKAYKLWCEAWQLKPIGDSQAVLNCIVQLRVVDVRSEGLEQAGINMIGRLQTILAYTPTDPKIHYALGEVCFVSGQHNWLTRKWIEHKLNVPEITVRKALVHFLVSIEGDPDNVRTLEALVKVYTHLEMPRELREVQTHLSHLVSAT